MSAAATVLFVAAFLIFVWPLVVLAAVWICARLDDEALRREQQDRETTPEWLAVLAATEPTPIYDRLVCEQMEHAEGWTE